uniref:Uncharacterized protein n=1 Tax=Manihot esculenta TaxID=3983 RepID=A0A2C9VY12_MANES
MDFLFQSPGWGVYIYSFLLLCFFLCFESIELLFHKDLYGCICDSLLSCVGFIRSNGCMLFYRFLHHFWASYVFLCFILL